MSTPTNLTPFAKAVTAFLGHELQSESKFADVLLAMVEMETTFAPDWTEKFLKTSGTDKTDMIQSTLRKVELPDYNEMLEALENKLAKNASIEDKIERERLSRRNHSLNMMVKQVAYALAGLQLRNAVKCKKVLGSRIAFYNEKDGTWNDMRRGDSFRQLVEDGKKLAKEHGWLPTTKDDVNSNKPSSGPASEGTVSVLTQLHNSLAKVLKGKTEEDLSESDQEALRQIEALVIKFQYATEDGQVDTECLADQYRTEVRRARAA